MEKLKKKFTKWYYNKGYRFGYNGITPDTAYWECPWYIKPLLIFFSPSVYFMCVSNKWVECFKRGMNEGKKWAEEHGYTSEQLRKLK